MNLRKTIEKQINQDIQYHLDEFDIDNYVKKVVSNKEVGKLVDQQVKQKLAEMIQEKAFMSIKKVMPIIDAYTNEKVREFLYSLGIKP